jgi:hypothetical protein
MPRKIAKEEEYELEEEDEDDEEELEVPEPPVRAKKKTVSKKPQKPTEPKRRYQAFFNPQRIGVADAETGEIVGEGEYAVYQVLADILERLERIENSIGSMLTG